ncbi:MAG: hypothetical protein LBP89_07300 [Helicobacteraceae bacterium]|jgi:outer membrane lipoprotein SlyB|nr:hypothetical protein [Helicobacteraceae bacterium]
MRFFWLTVVAFALVGCVSKSSKWEDLSACYGYGCEQYGRAKAVVSYARIAQNSKQDIELILDDGRIFAVYDYKGSPQFKIGDRVIVDYRYRKVKKIELIGSIYEDWRYYYAD